VKIVADANIAEVENAFRGLGEVELVPGRDIGPAHLADCRCLVVRTVTRVDAGLLHDSAVEFVATATIGTDHIDLEYLAERNIGFSNAAGCNAEGAAEYVVSGLFALSERCGFDPFARRVGIVGCGNVGGRLYHILTTLGIDCLVCDPPLALEGRSNIEFVDLDTLVEACDIISLHVPLTRQGDYPTFHLFDAARLRALVDNCLLINAARGEVVDNRALLELLHEREDLMVYLDTWEHEPLVSRELLRRVDLATPHIAGYSFEGRLRGTQMALDAACRHFGVTATWHMSDLLPPVRDLPVDSSGSGLEFWQRLFAAHFDIWRDHDAFTSGADFDDAQMGPHFDSLRRVFEDRLEYPRFRLSPDVSDIALKQLEKLGFVLG
jgi:erythronate-4-phosphate dehydrogenase